MNDQITELYNAANLLRTVNVGGDYWLTMHAVYNSIVKVAKELQKNEVTENETINNGANT